MTLYIQSLCTRLGRIHTTAANRPTVSFRFSCKISLGRYSGRLCAYCVHTYVGHEMPKTNAVFASCPDVEDNNNTVRYFSYQQTKKYYARETHCTEFDGRYTAERQTIFFFVFIHFNDAERHALRVYSTRGGQAVNRQTE